MDTIIRREWSSILIFATAAVCVCVWCVCVSNRDAVCPAVSGLSLSLFLSSASFVTVSRPFAQTDQCWSVRCGGGRGMWTWSACWATLYIYKRIEPRSSLSSMTNGQYKLLSVYMPARQAQPPPFGGKWKKSLSGDREGWKRYLWSRL